jgi:hypothetical protein
MAEVLCGPVGDEGGDRGYEDGDKGKGYDTAQTLRETSYRAMMAEDLEDIRNRAIKAFASSWSGGLDTVLLRLR